jgi:hypothetical protein
MKAKSQTKKITAEPATKAQPEPLAGAAASSTEVPAAPFQPNCVDRSGTKALWLNKIPAGQSPFGG